jgi:hypothetical protein
MDPITMPAMAPPLRFGLEADWLELSAGAVTVTVTVDWRACSTLVAAPTNVDVGGGMLDTDVLGTDIYDGVDPLIMDLHTCK